MKPKITVRQIKADLREENCRLDRIREENRRLDRKWLRKVPLRADKVPPDRVVVHNSVVPDAWAPQTPLAMHGFRAWTQIATGEIEGCPCKWAPWLGKHYRVAGAEPPPEGDYPEILRPFMPSRT